MFWWLSLDPADLIQIVQVHVAEAPQEKKTALQLDSGHRRDAIGR